MVATFTHIKLTSSDPRHFLHYPTEGDKSLAILEVKTRMINDEGSGVRVCRGRSRPGSSFSFGFTTKWTEDLKRGRIEKMAGEAKINKISWTKN